MARSEWLTVIRVIESRLGWAPANSDPHKARGLEVMKLKCAAVKNPAVTPENLRLAVEYCVRKRVHIGEPLELIRWIRQALELAVAPETVTDLDSRVRAAIELESARGGADSEYWVGRLVRAQGDARADVLAEWVASGAG